jgi:glycerate 2-kinase
LFRRSGLSAVQFFADQAKETPLQVLIAPTAFKGTLSPAAVARAVEEGIRRGADGFEVNTVLLPLADGGDGTIEAVHLAGGGALHQQQVLGPTGAPVLAHWLALSGGDEALVELAAVCGLSVLPEGKLEPMRSHTFGLGQMICRAFEMGSSTINIAIGGSASTDGGMGALRALGVAFFDKEGVEIETMGGEYLPLIADCDVTGARWLTSKARLRILTDVDNPLLGARGAAAIFGPQKGADQTQVKQLEHGLENFAHVVERCMAVQLRTVPGAGAAGGTAFGLAACLGAEICSGFDWVAGAAGLDAKLKAADLVITGEGRFDSQSLSGSGKTTGALLLRCRQQGKPLWLVAGNATGMDGTEGVDKLIVPQTGDSPWCNESDIAAAVSAVWRSELASLVQE